MIIMTEAEIKFRDELRKTRNRVETMFSYQSDGVAFRALAGAVGEMAAMRRFMDHEDRNEELLRKLAELEDAND